MEAADDGQYVFQGSSGDRASRPPKTDCHSLRRATVFKEEDSNVSRVIQGKAGLRKKPAKIYPRASYLPDPPFSKQAYKVQDGHPPSLPLRLPGNWESVARPGSLKSDHSIRYPEADYKNLECGLSRMKDILNMADWTSGFLVQKLAEVTTEPSSLTTETASQLLRVSRTVARTVSHLQRETIHLHCNTVLRRRDVYLGDLPREVSAEDVIKLRASTFHGPHLFDEELVKAAADRSDSLINRSAQLKILQSAKNKPDNRKPRTPSRPRPDGSFSRPRPFKSPGQLKGRQRFGSPPPDKAKKNQKDFSGKPATRGGRSSRGKRT